MQVAKIPNVFLFPSPHPTASDGQGTLAKPAEGPLSRRSFPAPLECTEMQLGFWNALMAGMSPDEHAPIDLASDARVLSDADVALRCSELRRPDPATPVHLLGRLGRCFRDAADAAIVTEDRRALLLRADAAYEAVHRAAGAKGAGTTSTVPLPGPSVSFNKPTAAGTPQRGGGGVGSSVGTPRSSYPSPFRARQLGQTQSPRSVAGSPLAPYSPFAQLAHRRARAPSPAQGVASTLLTAAGAAVDHPTSEDDVRRLIVECVVLCFGLKTALCGCRVVYARPHVCTRHITPRRRARTPHPPAHTHTHHTHTHTTPHTTHTHTHTHRVKLITLPPLSLPSPTATTTSPDMPMCFGRLFR
jgi:hypothetical protein